jgi:hypothetical protein
VVFFFHASAREEFRVVFTSNGSGGETRGRGEGFCIAVRQDGGTAASLGFGNPHTRNSSEYRSCTLPADADTTFWFLFDAGWIVFGYGGDVKLDGALLMLKLMPSDARLHLSHVCVSNWLKPITVSMAFSAELPSDALLQKLLMNRNKFDVQGRCSSIVGATTVCALSPGHPLHAAMTDVHDSINQEPLLCGLVALLPPSSFHMTVLDLFSGPYFDAKAKTYAASVEGLSGGLALAADAGLWALLPADHVTYMRSLETKLARAGISTSREWTTFPMRVTDISVTRASLSPWDDHTAAALTAWRQAVGDAFGIVVPPSAGSNGGRDNEYKFHATISYPLFPVWKQRSVAVTEAMKRVNRVAKELGEALSEPVFLRAPALCYFGDMAAFVPSY